MAHRSISHRYIYIKLSEVPWKYQADIVRDTWCLVGHSINEDTLILIIFLAVLEYFPIGAKFRWLQYRWNSKRRLPLIVGRSRKTNFRFPFFICRKKEVGCFRFPYIFIYIYKLKRQHRYIDIDIHVQYIYVYIYIYVNLELLYHRESNLAISSSPVTKIMYRFYWSTAIEEKKRNF
jgi:hypothetical protein